MQIRLHGVRGSRPTHKHALLGYGGNSTSIEFVVDEPFHLFVDGGSGLAKRGFELGPNPDKHDFHFLITHTHWDHILGFPFFEPFYTQSNHLNFYASNTSRSTFEHLFLGLQRADNLPVPRSALKAQVSFQTIHAEREFRIGQNVSINTYQLNHQGITLGYRVNYKGVSGCVITDNAPIHNGNYLGEGMAEKAALDKASFERDFEAGLVEFLRDSDLVIYDTHFMDDTLKPDWGHSTPRLAFDICRRAGVKRLLLFHHAPEDSDGTVNQKIRSILRDACQSGLEVEAAKEGDIWTLRSA